MNTFGFASVRGMVISVLVFAALGGFAGWILALWLKPKAAAKP